MWISRTYLHNWNFVLFDHHFPIYPSFQPLANTIWLCASLDSTEPTCNAGDPGSIPRSGRSPGEGNGYPLQYSCLQKSMHRGAWRATVQGSQRVGHDWVTNTFTFKASRTRGCLVLLEYSDGSKLVLERTISCWVSIFCEMFYCVQKDWTTG